MIGLVPGVLLGVGGTKFWLGGDATAILANAEDLLRNARGSAASSAMFTPVAQEAGSARGERQ